jgi:hypothetical protein
MVDKIQSANDLRNEIEIKDQLIDALQIKLREKKNQIDDMIDETYATNKKVDTSYDIEDLIEKIDAKCDTKEFIQMNDATCDTNEFIKKVDVACDTQNIIHMVYSTFDTHDLMVDTKETQDIDYNGPVKKIVFKNESKEA